MEAIYRYLETLPYAARLDYYRLSNAERALIRAMCSCTKDGAGGSIFTSLENCAMRAGISRKTAQRLVQGWTDRRTGVEHQGLKARGILTEIAPASARDRRAATYRVNWQAFVVTPHLVGVIERRLQLNLPGIKRPTVPDELGMDFPSATAGEAAEFSAAVQKHPLNPVESDSPYGHRDRTLRTPCPGTTDTVTTRVLDSSIGFSSRTSRSTAVSKSAWDTLPKGLQSKVDSELRVMYENQVGRSTYGWTPEDFARNEEHTFLIAAQRAGIWPHVAEKLAREEYERTLERERLSPGGNA
jgi:hypothetical protein